MNQIPTEAQEQTALFQWASVRPLPFCLVDRYDHIPDHISGKSG